jgi:hypothetical protein
MANEYETLRWPTNLNREGIVERLVKVHAAAAGKTGLADIEALFQGVEAMPDAKLAGNVIAALTWLEGKPDYRDITTQLEMVAMNLKNLKAG